MIYKCCICNEIIDVQDRTSYKHELFEGKTVCYHIACFQDAFDILNNVEEDVKQTKKVMYVFTDDDIDID